MKKSGFRGNGCAARGSSRRGIGDVIAEHVEVRGDDVLEPTCAMPAPGNVIRAARGIFPTGIYGSKYFLGPDNSSWAEPAGCANPAGRDVLEVVHPPFRAWHF
jgi:hypothetical protein